MKEPELNFLTFFKRVNWNMSDSLMNQPTKRIQNYSNELVVETHRVKFWEKSCDGKSKT